MTVDFFLHTNIHLESTKRASLYIQVNCPSQATTCEHAKTEKLLYMSWMWLLDLEKKMHFLIHLKKPRDKGDFIIILKAHKK